MARRSRKKDEPICLWCGTRLRGMLSCPRGGACAKEQADHDELMVVVGPLLEEQRAKRRKVKADA